MLVAFVAVTMVAFVGCTKEESNGGVDDSMAVGSEPDSIPDGWVDLGLPSGLLWAECNVGAMAPEEYGEYFAWGETTPKSNYDWSTYRHCTVNDHGSLSMLTKYNTMTDYGTVDSLTILEAADDAATARLGNGTRIPTKEEWLELMDNTTAEWVTQNGVYGCRFTASNDNTLFLPAAGFRNFSELGDTGSYCRYWTASLFANTPYCAWYSDVQEVSDFGRYCGLSVRAVRSR